MPGFDNYTDPGISKAPDAGQLGDIGGFGISDALTHFTQGFLGKKLENATAERKRKTDQEDFLVKTAYQAVNDLSGKDLSGLTDIPQGVKDQLVELHNKANQALMDDGIITAKEAQTLLALAHPIQSALEAQKSKESTPEFKAGAAERGKMATATEQGRSQLMSERAPLPEGIPGPPAPPATDDEIAQRGRSIYNDNTAAGMARVDPVSGNVMPAKELNVLQGKRESNESAHRDAANRLAEATKRRLQNDQHFWASQGIKDSTVAGERADRIAREAYAKVYQRHYNDTVKLSPEELANEANDTIDNMITSRGGSTLLPSGKPAPLTRPNRPTNPKDPAGIL